ncbi:hypothetical protein ABZ746_38135 [Streptomyces sp. NPDC020096]
MDADNPVTYVEPQLEGHDVITPRVLVTASANAQERDVPSSLPIRLPLVRLDAAAGLVLRSQPTSHDITVATQWRLTPDHVDALLTGTDTHNWDRLSGLLHVLGGDIQYFQTLWKAAEHPLLQDITETSTDDRPEPGPTPVYTPVKALH